MLSKKLGCVDLLRTTNIEKLGIWDGTQLSVYYYRQCV